MGSLGLHGLDRVRHGPARLHPPSVPSWKAAVAPLARRGLGGSPGTPRWRCDRRHLRCELLGGDQLPHARRSSAAPAALGRRRPLRCVPIGTPAGSPRRGGLAGPSIPSLEGRGTAATQVDRVRRRTRRLRVHRARLCPEWPGTGVGLRHAGPSHRHRSRHRRLEIPPVRHRRRHQQDRRLRPARRVHHRGVRGDRGRGRDGDRPRNLQTQPGVVDTGHGAGSRGLSAGARPGPEDRQPPCLRESGHALRGALRVLLSHGRGIPIR